jgi:hypothetical protein
MGFFGDKLDLITKLKIATSMSSSLEWEREAKAMFNGGMESLNSAKEGAKDDALAFLVDLTVSLIGTSFLNECVDKTFKTIFKKKPGGKSKLEELLQDELKKIIRSQNSSALVPAGFYRPDILGGYHVPMQVLDLFDLFKISPATPEGSVLFGSDSTSFPNQIMANVLQTNTPQTISSLPNATLEFNAQLKTLQIRGLLPISNEPHTINEFFDTVFNDPSFRLIDEKKVMADIVDAILSVLAKHKTKAALKAEVVLSSIVDRMSVDEETKEKVESYYRFSPEWYESIINTTEEKKKGKYVLHNSCQISEIEFTLEELKEIALKLETGSSVDVVEKIISDKIVTDGGVFTPAANESLKRGFLRAIIIAILKNTLFSPRIWLLFLLSTAFKKNYSQDKLQKFVISTSGEIDLINLIKEHQDVVTIITKFTKQALLNVFMNLVIKQIIRMITPWLIERQTEALVQYKNVIKSLSGFKRF